MTTSAAYPGRPRVMGPIDEPGRPRAARLDVPGRSGRVAVGGDRRRPIEDKESAHVRVQG